MNFFLVTSRYLLVMVGMIAIAGLAQAQEPEPAVGATARIIAKMGFLKIERDRFCLLTDTIDSTKDSTVLSEDELITLLDDGEKSPRLKELLTKNQKDLEERWAYQQKFLTGEKPDFTPEQLKKKKESFIAQEEKVIRDACIFGAIDSLGYLAKKGSPEEKILAKKAINEARMKNDELRFYIDHVSQ